MHARAHLIQVLAAAFALTGCSSIGPTTIKRDRTDYSSAMASSWKEMQLLNIVKFRYFDPPVFLDVPSVVSQQELYGQADLTSRLFHHELTNVAGTQNYYNVEALARYTDRPTVSYAPISGDRFINILLRPIPPATIFSMIDAGHDAAFILQLAVTSINGVFNYSLGPGRARPDDPRFRELVGAIRRIQQAGAIAARTTQIGSKPSTTVFFRRRVSASVERDIRLVKSLLEIDPLRDEFKVTGEPRHTPQEIAVDSRSMQEILVELAAGVEVPEGDVAEGRATRVPTVGDDMKHGPLIHIHSGPVRPVDAYSAVSYRDLSFWIDDGDLRSKRVFMFLMIFYALSETRAVPQAPVVTISASGR
jgi:hypothetical protein